MPTKAELQAELDALKAAQASTQDEDPRIAQAVELGIPREVAVAQFAGDAVQPEPEMKVPKYHATLLRSGKPARVVYLDDAKYLCGATVGADGKHSRVRKVAAGSLAAIAESDEQWDALRSALIAAAKCEGTHTFTLGDVFTS